MPNPLVTKHMAWWCYVLWNLRNHMEPWLLSTSILICSRNRLQNRGAVPWTHPNDIIPGLPSDHHGVNLRSIAGCYPGNGRKTIAKSKNFSELARQDFRGMEINLLFQGHRLEIWEFHQHLSHVLSEMPGCPTLAYHGKLVNSYVFIHCSFIRHVDAYPGWYT